MNWVSLLAALSVDFASSGSSAGDARSHNFQQVSMLLDTRSGTARNRERDNRFFLERQASTLKPDAEEDDSDQRPKMSVSKAAIVV